MDLVAIQEKPTFSFLQATYQVNQKLEGLFRDPVFGEVDQNVAIGRCGQLQAAKDGNTL